LKKKLCFDLDNVICYTNKNNYRSSKPKKKVINYINGLYSKDFKIIVFTARFMGRTNDNRIKATKMGKNFTIKQLKKWNLKYHKLIFGKPSYDVIIDDKSFGFKKSWLNNFSKIYK